MVKAWLSQEKIFLQTHLRTPNSLVKGQLQLQIYGWRSRDYNRLQLLHIEGPSFIFQTISKTVRTFSFEEGASTRHSQRLTSAPSGLFHATTRILGSPYPVDQMRRSPLLE